MAPTASWKVKFCFHSLHIDLVQCILPFIFRGEKRKLCAAGQSTQDGEEWQALQET